MAKPGRPRMLVNGRNEVCGRFVKLDHVLLASNAFRALSCAGRALIVELAMLYNGKNNGSIYLSVDDARDRLGFSDHNAAKKAFNELQALGFIEKTREAYFGVKAGEASRARCWRLTWLPGPRRGPASCEFKIKEPEAGTRERKRMERGTKALKRYQRARDAHKLPVLDSNTLDP